MNIHTIERLLAPLNNTTLFKLSLLCLVIVAVLGFIDFAIGPELSSSIFYVIPVSLAAWYGSRNLGLALSLISSLVWLASDRAAGLQVSSGWILVWNTLVRLGLFVIISELISGFRNQYDLKANAADTDPMTGIFNYGGFFRFAELELARGQRYGHPLSVVFFDLDNFKWVNDQLGHAQGDELLIYICRLVDTHIRKTDVFGRLGGDEFAILLIETAASDAEKLVEKLRQLLAVEMQSRQWPVSFSMGLISYDECPSNIKDIIGLADELMYRAKKGGKNNVVKLHCPGELDT